MGFGQAVRAKRSTRIQMMEEQMRKAKAKKHGEPDYQTPQTEVHHGVDVPTHDAPKKTVYYRTSEDRVYKDLNDILAHTIELYVNLDGKSEWQLVTVP
jgi:hypothetical protein